MSSSGSDLAFIISQPRSGSTLMQRILSAHPEVHSVSEPWLMLHPLYALRPEGHEAEYDAGLAYKALREYLKNVPGGDDAYYEAVRQMYGSLYRHALPRQARLFLDKTPRYYNIIPDLQRVFPEASFILLFRNPLSVLASIITTWIKRDWLRLAQSANDLLEAPHLLVEGKEQLGADAAVVHYENIVQQPGKTVQNLCEYLGLDYDPGMVRYGDQRNDSWRFGDQTKVHEGRPVDASVDKWIRVAEQDVQVWRLMNEYLNALGPVLVGQMGYDFQKLQEALATRQPNTAKLRQTFSLRWLLAKPKHRRSGWEHYLVKAADSLRQEGLKSTTARSGRALRRKVRALSQTR